MLTRKYFVVVAGVDGSVTAVACCLTKQHHYLRQLKFELIAHWNSFVGSLVLLESFE